MKKHVGLIILSCILIGCSPQQRLTRLIEKYPELKLRDSIRTIEVPVPVPYIECDTIIVPDSVLQACDSSIRANVSEGVSVTAGLARASLIKTDDGIVLKAEQLNDTINGEVTYPTPVFYTEPKKATEKPIQSFFRISGIIAWIALVLYVIGFVAIKKIINKIKQ